MNLPERPRQPGRRGGPPLTFWLVVAGLVLSALTTWAAWATSRPNWQLDWDVPLMVALTLVPLGPSGVASVIDSALDSKQRWPWLSWWGLLAVSLAWAEVWLDAGIYGGPWAKMLGGSTALLGTPLVSGWLLARSAWFWRRPGTATDHLAAMLAVLQLAGWAWFLLILLPLEFGRPPLPGA